MRFPNLERTGGFRISSDVSEDYNCFAFAADDTTRWWDSIHYWPVGVVIDESVEGFVRVYESVGFQRCQDRNLERGFSKIAIYAIGNEATHAARQLPNGKWTSKLGPDEDIEHALEGLEGDFYGTVSQIMKRPVSDQAAS